MPNEWCLYYDRPELDFGSWDGPPELAPGVGVQCAGMGHSAVGRTSIIQKDFYWWNPDEGRWYGGDQAGLLIWLFRDPGIKIVKAGTFVHADVYNAAIRRYSMDDRLPVKTGFTAQETPE